MSLLRNRFITMVLNSKIKHLDLGKEKRDKILQMKRQNSANEAFRMVLYGASWKPY